MEGIIKFLGYLTLVLIICALFAFPIMWLWNALMPDIFGIKEISWLQAWGLQLLCTMFFGNGIKK